MLGTPDMAKAVLGDYYIRIVSGIGLVLVRPSLEEDAQSNPQKERKDSAPSDAAGSHGGKKRAAGGTSADDIGNSSTITKRIRLAEAGEP